MKLITILAALILSASAYGQESENLHLQGPTTITYLDGKMFVADTIFLNGYKLKMEKKSMAKIEVIVGPGEVHLYPESVLYTLEKISDSITLKRFRVEAPKQEPVIIQKGK